MRISSLSLRSGKRLFIPLIALPDEDLTARGIVAKTADMKPGYPCRVTLEDAEPGERVPLFNYENHKAQTPCRSSYAIYVRDGADKAALLPAYDHSLIEIRFRLPIMQRESGWGHRNIRAAARRARVR